MRLSTLIPVTAYCLAAGVSAAAADHQDPVAYWNSIYYPTKTHEIRWISGVADDPASLLDWFRQSHPEVEIAKAGDGVYDLNVPPRSADDIVEYLRGALGDAQFENIALPPAIFIEGWSPNPTLAAALEGRKDWTRGPVFIDPGIRLSSDFTEVGRKIAALERERSAWGRESSGLPQTAKLVNSELGVLRYFARMDRAYNRRVTLRLRLLPAGQESREPFNQVSMVRELMKSWNIEPDASDFFDRFPFFRGSKCAVMPWLEVYIHSDDLPAMVSRVREFAQDAGAEIDEDCFPSSNPELSRSQRELVVLVPSERGKQFRENLRDKFRASGAYKRPAIIDGVALERHYLALRSELESSAGPLRTSPAIEGLLRAEIARLQPVEDRLEKARGRDALMLEVYAGGFVIRTGPLPVDAVDNLMRAPIGTPPPPNLPSGARPPTDPLSQ